MSQSKSKKKKRIAKVVGKPQRPDPAAPVPTRSLPPGAVPVQVPAQTMTTSGDKDLDGRADRLLRSDPEKIEDPTLRLLIKTWRPKALTHAGHTGRLENLKAQIRGAEDEIQKARGGISSVEEMIFERLREMDQEEAEGQEETDDQVEEGSQDSQDGPGDENSPEDGQEDPQEENEAQEGEETAESTPDPAETKGEPETETETEDGEVPAEETVDKTGEAETG